MMGKLPTGDNRTKGNSNLRYMKAKEGDRVKIFMINVIMTEEIIKIGIDQIAEIEEFNLVNK